MSNTTLSQHDAMTQRVGQCLMAWAQVEFQLGDMFRRFHGPEPQVATAVWDTVVSFDARVTMLQRVLKIRFPEGVIHDDTVLLLNEVRKRYKHRNEIAHSTLLLLEGNVIALEPFFVIGNERPKIRISDVDDRTGGFERLTHALAWLFSRMDPPQTTLQLASAPPLPGLVLELRAEESRRRTEQSERQKLLRHALKLQAEGRLPGWPPEAEGGS